MQTNQHPDRAPRSLCPICGPIVVATRGAQPAGTVGRTTGERGGAMLSCRACKGTGVFVPVQRRTCPKVQVAL